MTTMPAQAILAELCRKKPVDPDVARRWRAVSSAFEDEGWIARQLQRQAAVSDRYDLKACAALFMADYAHRFARSVALQYVRRRVVPDLSAEYVRVRERRRLRFHLWRVSRAMVFEVDIPRKGTAPSPDSLSRLRVQLEAHFTPLIAVLRQHTTLSAQALWRLAGDALAVAFLDAGRRARREGAAMADALTILKHPGSPFANAQMHYFKITVSDPDRSSRAVTRTFRQRGGCCRYYTAFPGKLCSTCVLKDPAERNAALESRLRRRLALRHLPKSLYQHAKARLDRYLRPDPRDPRSGLRGPSAGG